MFRERESELPPAEPGREALAGLVTPAREVLRKHFEERLAARAGTSSTFPEPAQANERPDTNSNRADEDEIGTAYRMRDFPVSGGPVWVD